MTTTQEIELSKDKSPLILLEDKRNELIELAKASEGLTISGIDDKDGFQKVHELEQKLVKARTGLNEIRLKYTKQFDEKKAKAISLEKELLAITLPAEERLKSEKARIAELKEQVRLEAERKAKEKLNRRVSELATVNATHDLFDLEMMEEADFLILLESKKSAFKAEQERIAKEAEEKAKYEAERASFEAEKAKLEAEKQAIQAEKDKIQREAELKQAQEEASAKAAKETEERMKREADEAEAKRIADKKAKIMQEAEELAELQRQANFKQWLTDNGVTAENKTEFEVRNEDGLKVLYKRISTYKA